MFKNLLMQAFFGLISYLFSLDIKDIEGIWKIPEEIEGQSSIGEIFIKDNKAFAYAFQYAYDKNGKLVNRDISNENSDAVRLKNTIFLSDLEFNGEKWVNGKIYRPSNGEVYNVSAKLLDKSILLLRVSYDGFGILGKTLIWHRLDRNEYNAPKLDSIKIVEHLKSHL